MKTPQQIVEEFYVSLVIGIVEVYARRSREVAPRAAIILEACAAKLREEYPDAEGGGWGEGGVSA